MSPLVLLTLVAAPQPLVQVTGKQLVAEIEKSGEPLVVVTAWATWCLPCVEELPMLGELQRRFTGKVRFVFVSTDFMKNRDRAAKILHLRKIPPPSFIKAERDGPFINAIHPDWNGTLPATIIFSKSGTRLRLMQGRLTKLQLAAQLEALLNEVAER